MGAPVRFTIRCWGARGTCPSPGPETVRYGGNTSCIEVRDPAGALIVLDAGTGIRGLGARMEKERDDSQVHVFLSHRHGDHVIGLPHFAPLLRHDRPVCLHCGNSDAAALEPFLHALLSPPIFPQLAGVTGRLQSCDWLTESAEDGIWHVAHVGSTHVHRLQAHHPGGAAVLRIDDAMGHGIAYAPDNELAYHDTRASTVAWRAALANSIRGIPVLIHDAMYSADELPNHVGWGHSSADEATRFALDAGVGTLVLFHHHPDRSDDGVDSLLARCRDIAGDRLVVLGASEGMELSIAAGVDVGITPHAATAPIPSAQSTPTSAAHPTRHHPASR
ncbi:MAG TPA: MBL fold metallo-hydrolase [Gemmatimonas sp.]|nr:MBL fold metallo-hydrolase [Gemmatimonas sp.]